MASNSDITTPTATSNILTVDPTPEIRMQEPFDGEEPATFEAIVHTTNKWPWQDQDVVKLERQKQKLWIDKMLALKNGLFDRGQVTYSLEPGSKVITFLECVDMYRPRAFRVPLEKKYEKGPGVGDGGALKGRGRVYTCEEKFVEITGIWGYETMVWVPREIAVKKGVTDFCEVTYTRIEGSRHVTLEKIVKLEEKEEEEEKGE